MLQGGLTAAQMKSLEKYITTTSQVYYFQVMGYLDGGGPVVRLEVIVDANGQGLGGGTIPSATGATTSSTTLYNSGTGQPIIVYVREIGPDFGLGFDVTTFTHQ